eukprot:2859426-Prymnesium_polylepis.1
MALVISTSSPASRTGEGEHVQELARRADRMGIARPVMQSMGGRERPPRRAARFPASRGGGGQADKAPAPETSLQRSSSGRLDELQVS